MMVDDWLRRHKNEIDDNDPLCDDFASTLSGQDLLALLPESLPARRREIHENQKAIERQERETRKLAEKTARPAPRVYPSEKEIRDGE
jgi:hypothetical protein